jgi:hypothetical protein
MAFAAAAGLRMLPLPMFSGRCLSLRGSSRIAVFAPDCGFAPDIRRRSNQDAVAPQPLDCKIIYVNPIATPFALR